MKPALRSSASARRLRAGRARRARVARFCPFETNTVTGDSHSTSLPAAGLGAERRVPRRRSRERPPVVGPGAARAAGSSPRRQRLARTSGTATCSAQADRDLDRRALVGLVPRRAGPARRRSAARRSSRTPDGSDLEAGVLEDLRRLRLGLADHLGTGTCSGRVSANATTAAIRAATIAQRDQLAAAALDRSSSAGRSAGGGAAGRRVAAVPVPPAPDGSFSAASRARMNSLAGLEAVGRVLGQGLQHDRVERRRDLAG